MMMMGERLKPLDAIKYLAYKLYLVYVMHSITMFVSYNQVVILHKFVFWIFERIFCYFVR